jgi:hypothetical protein
MSNVIQFSINGDTNAEKVTDRVKQSVSALEKNMQGIESKFKSFGKDLFLSFAAPMVILNQAINMISGAIEKSRQEVRDALADAEKGENKYMRAGTTASAREVAARRQDALDRKNAKLAAEALADEQLKESGEGDAAITQYEEEGAKIGKWEAFKRDMKGMLFWSGLSSMSTDTEMQDVLERRAQARMANSPEGKAQEAAAKQKEAAESQIKAQKDVDKMSTTFKGPEGFSNVVGVGANPVLEAMSSQLEEAKRTNELLAQLVTSGGGRTSSWLEAPTGNPHVDGYGDQM